MWIHWSVQRVETSLGSVADFCPICRALRAFRIVEIERTTELLHVPLARTPLGRFLRCLSCDARIAADAEAHAAFAGADEEDVLRRPLGCGGALLALIAGPWISRELPPSWQWLVGAMLGLSFALGLYTLFEFFRNPGRSAGQRVVPLLARALAPLKPLDEELALCLFHGRKEGWRIGRVVRIGPLRAELQECERAIAPGA